MCQQYLNSHHITNRRGLGFLPVTSLKLNTANMKRVLYLLIIAAMAATFFTAGCTKENKAEPESVEPVEVGGLTLSITIPNAVPVNDTRSVQEPSALESEIKTVSVFVFNPNGTRAAAGAHTKRTVGQFTNVQGVWKLKDADYIATAAGENMKIYVGVNLPTSIDTLYNTEAALLDVIANLDHLDSSINTGFSMFSTGVTTTSVAVFHEDNVSNIASVYVKVERIVAKVVTTNSAPVSALTATWSGIGTGNTGPTMVFSITNYRVFNYGATSYIAPKITSNTRVSTQRRTNFEQSLIRVPHTEALHVIATPTGTEAQRQTARRNLPGYYVCENIGGTSYGNATYVYVASTVNITHAAGVSGNNIVYAAVPGGYGKGTSDVFVVRDKVNEIDYVTNNESKANAVALFLDNGSKYYIYRKGYVHFPICIYRVGDGKFDVLRNWYIHVDITGLAGGGELFHGYPGRNERPEDPTDPTIDNGNNPWSDAWLAVNIRMEAWDYLYKGAVLQ